MGVFIMNKRKNLKRIVASVAAVTLLGGVLMNNDKGVKAVDGDYVPPIQDSASAINYATVLGGAVDYGIVADKIIQNSHMETTFATNHFDNSSGQNNDPDYVPSTAHSLVQNLDAGKIEMGWTTASAVYFEAPQAVFGDYDSSIAAASGVSNGNFVFRNTYGDAPLIQAVNEDASSNVDRLINRIGRQSDTNPGWSQTIHDRATDSDYVLNPEGYDPQNEGPYIYVQHGGKYDGKLIIDVEKPDFINKVVYVSVNNAMLDSPSFSVLKKSMDTRRLIGRHVRNEKKNW